MSKKSSSVLQKKLQDLESELTIAFSLPPHQAPSTYRLCSQYFDNRFNFLKKLISAEIASSTSSRPKKPSYLQKVVRRFTELETKFQEWESFTSKASSTVLDHDFEPVSTCSCAESRANDDGNEDADASRELGFPGFDEKYYEELAEEKVHAHNMKEEVEKWLSHDEEEGGAELESPGFEEAKKLLEGLRKHEEVNNTIMEEVGGGSEKELKGDQERRMWVGKYVGAMAAGLVLGVALMGSFMVRFSGCFQYVEHDGFPPPT